MNKKDIVFYEKVGHEYKIMCRKYLLWGLISYKAKVTSAYSEKHAEELVEILNS